MARLLNVCSLIIIIIIGLANEPIYALENGLARTPPMGWINWERFTCEVNCQLYPKDCIRSSLFTRMADHLFYDGWLAAGYSYLNIDDCWSEMARDIKNDELVPSNERFYGANGIEEVAEYVHRYDGMKLGIYGDCGSRTCGGYPGQLKENNQTNEEEDFKSATYFQLDARTFARWQVDSLKFDGCYVDPLKAERICSKMSTALAETRRPILLICEWPFYMMYAHAEADWELTASSCNAWRYYDDIEGEFFSLYSSLRNFLSTLNENEIFFQKLKRWTNGADGQLFSLYLLHAYLV